MSEFVQCKFITKSYNHLFNSEIVRLIIENCDKQDLVLPDNFSRNHYEFYTKMTPFDMEYLIVFQARPKTADDILREQLEFLISNL